MPTSASGHSDDSTDSLTPVGDITLGDSSFAGAEADTAEDAAVGSEEPPSIAADQSEGTTGSITRLDETEDSSAAEDTGVTEAVSAASDLTTTAAVESESPVEDMPADDSDTDEPESGESSSDESTTGDADAAETVAGPTPDSEPANDDADAADEQTETEPDIEDETETEPDIENETENDSESAAEEPAAQESEPGDADDGAVDVPDIIFPVVGPVTYSDTWGACRGTGCSRSHKGVDIFAAKLAPLVAAADGVITSEVRSGLSLGGNHVIVTSDDGWRYLYIHLNNDSPGTDDGANPQGWIIPNGLRSGDRVKAGDVIGYNGDSGNAETTPAHVHFEIHQPGVGAINPTEAVQKAEAAGRVVSTSTLASTAENRAEHAPVVSAWYRALLKREPTDAEMFAWTDRFAIGFADLDDLIADVTMAKPRRDSAGAVLRSFEVALDRRPTLNELRAWDQEYRSGATIAEITGVLIASEPFKSAHGDLSDEEFVRVIYRNAVSTEPTEERLAEWLAVFDDGGDRSDLTSFWADSYSVKNSTWHELEVIQAFRATLDRMPTDAEYDLWVSHLDDGGLIIDVVTGIRVE